MARFRAFAESRFFHFHEVADVRAFFQLGTGTQTRKRSDGAGGVKPGIFHNGVSANFAIIANDAVFNDTARADFHPIAQRHVAFNNDIGINFDVTPVG